MGCGFGSWWVCGGWGVLSRGVAVVAWGYGFCLVVVCVCLFVFFFSSWWWHGFCGWCLMVFGDLCVCVCVFVGGSCWWVWWFF